MTTQHTFPPVVVALPQVAMTGCTGSVMCRGPLRLEEARAPFPSDRASV